MRVHIFAVEGDKGNDRFDGLTLEPLDDLRLDLMAGRKKENQFSIGANWSYWWNSVEALFKFPEQFGFAP